MKPKASSSRAGASFPAAFAALLHLRKIRVPSGLEKAPGEAYAHQGPELVEQLSGLSDEEIERFAERVASYADRQARRAEREWESSPLIGELRRRKLPEPDRPRRATGVSVSLTKPLAEWSDGELLDAARAWSRKGSA